MNNHIHAGLRPLLLILSAALLLGVCASAETPHNKVRTQIKTDKLMKSENVEVVYISPTVLKLAPESLLLANVPPSLHGFVKGMTALHIFSSSNPEGIKELRSTFAPLLKKNNNPDLLQLMSVKEEGSVVNMVGQLTDETITELYMIVLEDEECTVISFSGEFAPSDLTGMMTDM